MTEIHATEERMIDAPADLVHECIANYRDHHHRFLPPTFSDYQVEQGGFGAGTVVTVQTRVGGSSRTFRVQVAEPEPGRMLTESEIDGTTVTTFTVTPEDGQSGVRFETRYQAAGPRGFVERLVAPRMLRRIYADESARLECYAQSLKRAS